VAMLSRTCRRGVLGVVPAVALVLGLGVASGRQAGKSDWVNLLEGGSLAKHWTTAGNWKLDKDGVVSLEPRPGEKGWQRYDPYLWSRGQYGDFEAEFDYKVAKAGNSGFFFNVGDLKDPVNKGLEVQIYDSFGKKKEAKLTDHDSGGIIPGFPPTKRAARPT